MKRAIPSCLLALILSVAAAVTLPAGQPKPGARNAARFGKYIIESRGGLEGTIGGPWEFSKGVTVTGPDLVLTCDTLKVWPGAKGGRDFERAEATGNITVRGRYLARDGAEWQVVGSAASGTFDGKTGQGVMRGGVKFNGTNQATKAVLSVVADKMVYQVKTQQFRFERGGEPVVVQWEEPQQPAAAAKQEGGK